MTVPIDDRFIEPVIRFLAAHPDGVAARDAHAHAHAASTLGLSDDHRQQLLPSGAQPIDKNRAGWAHDRLKRAGLSRSPRRGFWQATADGLALAAGTPAPFPPELVDKLATGYGDVQLRAATSPARPASEPATSSSLPLPPSAAASPDDRLGLALLDLRQAAESELLELLAAVTPSDFETIVLDLLHRMGDGANRADLQRVGGSGDGGIDGVISLDRLGLEKIYVQAKRWQENIGRPHLQAFYGALAGQKARKGVFITTSAYTAQALDFARSVDGIVLIDGARLAGLMIDFEVGVTARTIRVPKIDGDYFDEEVS